MARADAVQMALPTDRWESGEVAVWRLHFPFAPPSKNTYDSTPPIWQSSMKRKWIRWVAKLVEEQQVPHGLPRIALAARIGFPTRRRRDPQNYAGPLWNFVPDGLVRAGVIPDDENGRIQFGPQLGLQMVHDGRLGVKAADREWTILTIAARIP